jgi:hypothetical protein
VEIGWGGLNDRALPPDSTYLPFYRLLRQRGWRRPPSTYIAYSNLSNPFRIITKRDHEIHAQLLVHVHVCGWQAYRLFASIPRIIRHARKHATAAETPPNRKMNPTASVFPPVISAPPPISGAALLINISSPSPKPKGSPSPPPKELKPSPIASSNPPSFPPIVPFPSDDSPIEEEIVSLLGEKGGAGE